MSAQTHSEDASLVRSGDAWSLIVGTRSYAVSFAEPDRGELIVYVNGRAVPVARTTVRLKADTPADGVSGLSRTGESGQTGEGGRTGAVQITAPMPGRIVKVLVQQGDRVAARQGLVVVEAMKMENELRAPKDGVVTDVRVTEGASVEARAVLIVLGDS